MSVSSERVWIELPISPLSVNAMYCYPANLRTRVLTDEGRKWKRKAHILAIENSDPRNRNLSGPISLDITYYFFRQIQSYPEVRGIPLPDVTNYDKALLDALSGVLWEDDKQIVECNLRKRLANSKDNERILIGIDQLDLDACSNSWSATNG